MCQWPWEKKSRGMRSRTAMSLKLLGLSSEVRGEDSQYLYQSNAERKKYFKVKLPIDFFWEMCELVDKSIASKRTFRDFEGHCYSTFTSNFPPPRSFFFSLTNTNHSERFWACFALIVFFFYLCKAGFTSCHHHSIHLSTAVHRWCVCPSGRGRHCGFIWSYKPSGWAELC